MARQNWSAFCQLDSDRDGLANGIELLDPQCVWRPGQPRPLGQATTQEMDATQTNVAMG